MNQNPNYSAQNSIVAELAKIYSEYLNKSEEAYKSKKFGEALRKLSGGGDEFAKHPMHAEFYAAVQEKVVALAQALKEDTATQDDALFAVNLLLSIDSNPRFDKDSILSFGLVPVEQYSTELFSFISAQSLLAVYDEYKKQIGAFPLPLQENVCRELEKAIKAKGAQVPKQKSFLERLFKK